MIIYEFEHEEGAYYGNLNALFSFKKSAERKFGKWINIREVEYEDLADWVRSCWRIPYVYKPHAKRVVRFNKRKDLKKRLKNKKILYAQASKNSYVNFLELLSEKDKCFIEFEFKSLKSFHRYCRNIDKYKIPQTLLADHLSINRRIGNEIRRTRNKV